MALATGEQGARAEDVGAEEIIIPTPDANTGGRVKNRGDARAGGLDGGRVVKRGADEFHAACNQVGRRGAAEYGDAAALRQEALDDAPAQKAGATGDEGAHVSDSPLKPVAVAVQRASVRRWILALWRTSTGKFG